MESDSSWRFPWAFFVRRDRWYLLAFASIVLSFALTDVWKRFDAQLGACAVSIRTSERVLANDLDIVALPDLSRIPDRAGRIATGRRDIAELLELIENRTGDHPEIIVLDVTFGRDEVGQDRLVRVLERLKKHGVHVISAVDVLNERLNYDAGYEARHNAKIYKALAGAGHTVLRRCELPFCGDLHFLCARLDLQHAEPSRRDPCLASEAAVGDTAYATVPALPVVLRAKRGEPPMLSSRAVPIYAGSSQVFEDRLQFFTPRWKSHQSAETITAATPETLSLTHNVLLVGSKEDDQFQSVAWSISSFLELSDPTGQRQPPLRLLDAGLWLVPIVLVVCALHVILFFWLFGLMDHRGLRWIVAAVGSIVFWLVAFSVMEFGLIKLGYFFPQIGLPLFSLAVLQVISLIRAGELERWDKLLHIPPTGKIHTGYDVFISYHHKSEKMLAEKLCDYLGACTHSNGAKLRVFLDARELKGGVLWFDALAQAVCESRWFVPIYSKAYFSRDYCMLELRQAARQATVRPQERFVVPILVRCDRGEVEEEYTIPPGYDDFQGIELWVGRENEGIAQLCARIRDRAEASWGRATP